MKELSLDSASGVIRAVEDDEMTVSLWLDRLPDEELLTTFAIPDIVNRGVEIRKGEGFRFTVELVNNEEVPTILPLSKHELTDEDRKRIDEEIEEILG